MNPSTWASVCPETNSGPTLSNKMRTSAQLKLWGTKSRTWSNGWFTLTQQRLRLLIITAKRPKKRQLLLLKAKRKRQLKVKDLRWKNRQRKRPLRNLKWVRKKFRNKETHLLKRKVIWRLNFRICSPNNLRWNKLPFSRTTKSWMWFWLDPKIAAKLS